MNVSALMTDIDDWCGTPHGRPPRPPWLRDALSAVILTELSVGAVGERREELYAVAGRLYDSVAEQVALNPQPLPPLDVRVSDR